MDIDERREEEARGQKHSLHLWSGRVFIGAGGKDYKAVKIHQECTLARR